MMIARSKLLPYAAVAVLAGLAAAQTLRPAIDHDTWWHLRIGQFIDHTGTVPETDPISRMGLDGAVPWQAYSWLYEWLLFQCHATGGFAGILGFRTLLAAFSTAVVFAFILNRTGWTLAGFALLLGVSVPLMPMATERPWHFTIAFTALTLWAVQSMREGRSVRRSIWLLPLFSLWANLHIQFVLGWLVLGLACVDPGRANRKHVVLLALGCVLATFANPYHVRLIPVIWDYATQAAPRAIIFELSPPDLFARWTISVVALVGWAVANFISRRSYEPYEWGLLIAGAYFASRMNRDLWFGALAAAAVIRTKEIPAIRPNTLAVVATVVGVYFGLRILNSAGRLGDANTEAANARTFPIAAVVYLQESRPVGPLFNDLSWGGYLAWALPEYPVTIDGRTNLYGSERLAQSSRTWSSTDGWKTDAELAKCNVILAQKGRPFTEALRELHLQWRPVYEDDIAVVFVRTAP